MSSMILRSVYLLTYLLTEVCFTLKLLAWSSGLGLGLALAWPWGNTALALTWPWG